MSTPLTHTAGMSSKEAQMADGFGIIDRAFDLVDEVFKG